MSLIIFLLIGALVGWLASLITGTREGLVMDMVVGVIGSFLAGTVVEYLRTGTLDLTSSLSLNPISFIVSVIGAVVLIALIKAFKGRSAYTA